MIDAVSLVSENSPQLRAYQVREQVSLIKNDIFTRRG